MKKTIALLLSLSLIVSGGIPVLADDYSISADMVAIEDSSIDQSENETESGKIVDEANDETESDETVGEVEKTDGADDDSVVDGDMDDFSSIDEEQYDISDNAVSENSVSSSDVIDNENTVVSANDIVDVVDDAEEVAALGIQTPDKAFIFKTDILNSTFNKKYNLNGGVAQTVNYGKRKWKIAGYEKYNAKDTIVLFYSDDDDGHYLYPYVYDSNCTGTMEPDYKKSTVITKLNDPSTGLISAMFKEKERENIVPVTLDYVYNIESPAQFHVKGTVTNQQLYLPDYISISNKNTIYVGAANGLAINSENWPVVKDDSYVPRATRFLLRSTDYANTGQFVVGAMKGQSDFNRSIVATRGYAVAPAFNMSIDKLLFASTAPVATDSLENETSHKLVGDAVSITNPMSFRFCDDTKIKSTLKVKEDSVTVTKNTDAGSLMLCVFDETTNKIYADTISSTTTMVPGDFEGLSSFKNCKVWIETYISDDDIIYADMDPEQKASTPAAPSEKVGQKVTSGKSSFTVTSVGDNNTVTYMGDTTSNAKKKLTTATIPDSVIVNGTTYKVTEIAPKAFNGYAKIKKVTIGANITKIGSKAFYNCKNLKTVTVKSTNITSVGKSAFKNLKKSASIKVPKSCKKKYQKLFKKAINGTTKVK